MTRDEMVAVIQGGGAVLYRGVIYTRSADLPSQVDTASGVPQETLTDASGTPITQWPVTVADGANVAQGAKADAAWTSGSGSLVALLKALVGKIPVLGAAATAASLPVNVASDQVVPVKGSFTELAGLTAGSLNADLVPSTDVSGYKWVSVQVLGTYTGTLTPQVSNDGANWMSSNLTVPTSGGLNTSIVNQTGLYFAPVVARYFRLRMTAYTSGTATGVAELYTAATSASIGTVSVLQLGGWSVGVTASTSGGTTPFRLISAATTNATSLKASAGQLYGGIAGNTTASWKFVKFYNKASAPTVGTDTPVFVLPVPPNGVAPYPSETGMAFGTGIACAITGAAADSDTTAVAAGDVVLSGEYK